MDEMAVSHELKWFNEVISANDRANIKTNANKTFEDYSNERLEAFCAKLGLPEKCDICFLREYAGDWTEPMQASANLWSEFLEKVEAEDRPRLERLAKEGDKDGFCVVFEYYEKDKLKMNRTWSDRPNIQGAFAHCLEELIQPRASRERERERATFPILN